MLIKCSYTLCLQQSLTVMNSAEAFTQFGCVKLVCCSYPIFRDYWAIPLLYTIDVAKKSSGCFMEPLYHSQQKSNHRNYKNRQYFVIGLCTSWCIVIDYYNYAILYLVTVRWYQSASAVRTMPVCFPTQRSQSNSTVITLNKFAPPLPPIPTHTQSHSLKANIREACVPMHRYQSLNCSPVCSGMCAQQIVLASMTAWSRFQWFDHVLIFILCAALWLKL